MGKRYLLDSNAVIDYIARLFPSKAWQWMDDVINNEINVSVITKIEVLSFDPEDKEYPILIDFFNEADIFGLTDNIINKTIQIRQKQKTKLPDAVIAATAIVNELILLTRNTRDFDNIEGLEVMNPYQL